jgi:hypothetical protein
MRLRISLLAFLLGILVACGGNSATPTGPSTPIAEPRQTPDQSNLEPLGTVHRLMDPITGVPSTMQARIDKVSPDRRSIISPGPLTKDCMYNCFRYQGWAAMDPGEPDNHGASIAVYFSEDGETTIGDPMGGGSPKPGGEVQLGNFEFRNEFVGRPKWLILKGSHYSGTPSNSSTKYGVTRFELAYQ